MMYMEDFLEKLELLPQEIINQTSEIRQLDQQVKNSMDCMKENLDNLFSNANSMHPDDLNADFKTTMKVGDKVLMQSDEKIQIAKNMQKLMKKYLNHIDIELHKFKVDLDVEKSNTTELNEKKIEKYSNNDCSFKEKCLVVDSNISSTNSLDLHIDTIPTYPQMDLYPLSHTLEHMVTDSSGISAAASKVAASTKKCVKGGRKGILKVSTEAINCNKTSSVVLSPKWRIYNKLQSGGSNKNPTKKRTKNLKKERTNNSIDVSTVKDKNELNERRYCLCNEFAYDTMIACDNSKCPHEWFHYQCVGIMSSPAGKWYCPKCVIKLKKRRQ